ncbi:unnamed protein product [Gordionus sp. m RMFG-2023]|uniref:Kv channel-interacting protein 4-like n=1 Tax=Gordionus sp. m RMFG-2023 TaxID=3053472 RepID=UPI0030E1ED30
MNNYHAQSQNLLQNLCLQTKFDRKEIQILYQGFKQECPNGVLNFNAFKQIYGTFFPAGNSTKYSYYVFKSLDKSRTGTIVFEDFARELSAISKGSLEDKLKWAFKLYDVNGDGFISREEMTSIVTAIYELFSKFPEECRDKVMGDTENFIKNHVERIFRKMDSNKDGKVTSEEFMNACIKDKNLTKSIEYLNTIFV